MTRRLECRHCGAFNHPGNLCRCGGPKIKRSDFDPLTPIEIANALDLIADSDFCKNNTMLASILLIASSCIKELIKIKSK